MPNTVLIESTAGPPPSAHAGPVVDAWERILRWFEAPLRAMRVVMCDDEPIVVKQGWRTVVSTPPGELMHGRLKPRPLGERSPRDGGS
jgi:hypothetical protein